MKPRRQLDSEEAFALGLARSQLDGPTLSPGQTYEIMGKPTSEYLAGIVGELDRLGLSVRIMDGQSRLTGEPEAVRNVPKRLVDSLKRHRFALLNYLAANRGLDLSSFAPPLPPKGAIVEWVNADATLDLDTRGVCTAEELPGRNWVRWRIRGTKVWYAYSGETWEE